MCRQRDDVVKLEEGSRTTLITSKFPRRWIICLISCSLAFVLALSTYFLCLFVSHNNKLLPGGPRTKYSVSIINVKDKLTTTGNKVNRKWNLCKVTSGAREITFRKIRSASGTNRKDFKGCLYYLDTSNKAEKEHILRWSDSYTTGMFVTNSKCQLVNGSRIKVIDEGWYQIYTSIQLDAYATTHKEEFQIVQINLLKNPGEHLLTYSKYNIERKDSFPIKINLPFYLQKDDEIYININVPSYIYFQPEPNFFGVIKFS